jgi:Nif-specific regulatory protein
MQHGMLCLYDNQQEILSIEALQEADQHLIPAARKFAIALAKGW